MNQQLFSFIFIFRRIMTTKTADEFYCKMGTLSGELLNGHLFDSNGLIQRIVDLGPIADLQKMREKHLFNITPWKDRRGLRFDRNCMRKCSVESFTVGFVEF